MAGFASSIFHSISRGYLFSKLTHFINPELLSALMYASIFLAYGLGYLSYPYLENFSNYMIVEFLMIHSNVGIAGVLVFATDERSKKAIIIGVGSFYFLFMLSMAIGFGAWWTAFVFILILYSRMITPLVDPDKSNLKAEILITFGRFFIYMFSAIIGYGVAITFIGNDDTYAMITWGIIYYFSLFLLRNKLPLLRVFIENTAPPS